MDGYQRGNFNPLSPHGERRERDHHGGPGQDFNPLSPHGERRKRPWRPTRRANFNPLSPHGERPSAPDRRAANTTFQSTLPAWGETTGKKVQEKFSLFQSTLPAWGETCPRRLSSGAAHFNPLSPHGERHSGSSTPGNFFTEFQSTLPAWGETDGVGDPGHRCRISIHSPRMGRDSKRTQLFEEKNWRICTTLYLFASKEVLPADKKTF